MTNDFSTLTLTHSKESDYVEVIIFDLVMMEFNLKVSIDNLTYSSNTRIHIVIIVTDLFDKVFDYFIFII